MSNTGLTEWECQEIAEETKRMKDQHPGVLASAQVHAEQQERLAKHLSADEQRFWDAAFCAALEAWGAHRSDLPFVIKMAAEIADTALAARQQRGK